MRVGPIYGVEALSSMGGTLFTVGIFFYTSSRFGWGLAQNFRLAVLQGAVYVIGAMSAHAIARRLTHKPAAMLLQTVLTCICVVGVLAGLGTHPMAVAAVVLAYTLTSATSWPILASLVTMGADAAHLARRLAVYNVIWPAVGAASLAASGRVIEAFPLGVFLLPAVAHLLSIGLLTRTYPLSAKPTAVDEPAPPATTPHAEPELLRLRKVALWVSRLGLPATYSVIYGLMPLMPTILRQCRIEDTQTQTVVGATWLVARWAAFVGLAASAWWHTRPRAMVAAAILMLFAFLGVTLAPSRWLGPSISPAVDLGFIVFWQIVLGASLGMIYTGSLYFGMVLSEGSTEHSGYHEALIGLGWMLGPGVGAIAGIYFPGSLTAAVAAVGALIAVSVACVVAASVIGARRPAQA